MARVEINRRRLGISVLLAVAVTMIIYGFASARTGDQAVVISDAAVESVYPKPGDIVLRQSEIKVDLAPGYRGILIVDGQEVPTYDLVSTDGNAGGAAQFDAVYDPALNTVSFTPRVGATIEAFAPDRHTVTVVFWRLDESRDRARSITWSFKVS